VHQPELSLELCQVMQSPSSVFELWQRGASAWAQFGALPGDATTELSFELCQVMQSPSSVFELCQVMQSPSSVFELWQREAIAWAQSSSSARRCHLSSQEVQPPDPRILGFDRFDRFELQIWTGLGPINTPPIQHWKETDPHRILDLFSDSKSSNLCKVLKFSSFCSSSLEL
jgi:hypothetical protein